MVLSSHGDMEDTNSKTGVWLGEFTDPYYTFIDHGYEVVLASPAGGEPPIDPMSRLTEHITEANRRFDDDYQAKAAFSNTVKLDTVDASAFDGVFYPGGHGPLWDLATDATSGQLILDFIAAGKPVGAVCHGPAALIKAAEIQIGFLNGKKITAFTDTEEALVNRLGNIPYKLETRLMELGADFSSASIPFTANVEVDGLLITGQNPLSAGPVATAFISVLEKLGSS